MMVLGTEPRSSEKQPMLLTTEASLQSLQSPVSFNLAELKVISEQSLE